MKPSAVDVRARVLAAIARGMPRSAVGTTFTVGLASRTRWRSSRRDTGDFRPRPPPGGPDATCTPACDDEVRAQVAAVRDATLPQHAERWNATHQPHISHGTIGRASPCGCVAQHTSLRASARDRWERARVLVQQEAGDPNDVVVRDEFGSNRALTPHALPVHPTGHGRLPPCPAPRLRTRRPVGR